MARKAQIQVGQQVVIGDTPYVVIKTGEWECIVESLDGETRKYPRTSTVRRLLGLDPPKAAPKAVRRKTEPEPEDSDEDSVEATELAVA
jgi:hypothetical protein